MESITEDEYCKRMDEENHSTPDEGLPYRQAWNVVTTSPVEITPSQQPINPSALVYINSWNLSRQLIATNETTAYINFFGLIGLLAHALNPRVSFCFNQAATPVSLPNVATMFSQRSLQSDVQVVLSDITVVSGEVCKPASWQQQARVIEVEQLEVFMRTHPNYNKMIGEMRLELAALLKTSTDANLCVYGFLGTFSPTTAIYVIEFHQLRPVYRTNDHVVGYVANAITSPLVFDVANDIGLSSIIAVLECALAPFPTVRQRSQPIYLPPLKRVAEFPSETSLAKAARLDPESESVQLHCLDTFRRSFVNFFVAPNKLPVACENGTWVLAGEIMSQEHIMIMKHPLTTELCIYSILRERLAYSRDKKYFAFPVVSHELADVGYYAYIQKLLYPVSCAECNFFPFVTKACRALKILHSLGILHGDVKPSNFMTVTYGDCSTLILNDFGASIINPPIGSPLLVNPQAKLGAPHAPEWSEGGNYCWSLDVYSLGVTCQLMFEGRAPAERLHKFCCTRLENDSNSIYPSVDEVEDFIQELRARYKFDLRG